jgi:hypothetical protein
MPLGPSAFENRLEDQDNNAGTGTRGPQDGAHCPCCAPLNFNAEAHNRKIVCFYGSAETQGCKAQGRPNLCGAREGWRPGAFWAAEISTEATRSTWTRVPASDDHWRRRAPRASVIRPAARDVFCRKKAIAFLGRWKSQNQVETGPFMRHQKR